MQHTLILTAEEFEKYGDRRFLVTKHDPLFQEGDTALLTKDGTRDQAAFTIVAIETGDKIHKGWCVLGLVKPEEVVRDFSQDPANTFSQNAPKVEKEVTHE